MFELIVIYYNDDNTYIYEYDTEAEAIKAENNIRMAAGNQVSWTGIRKSTKAARPKKKTGRNSYFKRGADIPKPIRNRTYYNMKKYHLSLCDAFEEAVRALYDLAPEELQRAWYEGDLRNYIPSAYIQ